MLRLPAFELHTPATVGEALALASSLEGARFIAAFSAAIEAPSLCPT